MATGGYVEISRDEALKLPSSEYSHAAHAMLYAKWPQKLFGKYDLKYAVMMQVRFDGTLGFPGGLVHSAEGELPEAAVSREFAEESGCVGPEVSFSAGDHVATNYSTKTRLCLHFFAREVSLEQLTAVERSTVVGREWGDEVMGVVRCPLYTLHNGLGFPAFLRHKFIGNSREQLLMGLERRGLLSAEEVQRALETSRTVNNYVTREEIKY